MKITTMDMLSAVSLLLQVFLSSYAAKLKTHYQNQPINKIFKYSRFSRRFLFKQTD